MWAREDKDQHDTDCGCDDIDEVDDKGLMAMKRMSRRRSRVDTKNMYILGSVVVLRVVLCCAVLRCAVM